MSSSNKTFDFIHSELAEIIPSHVWKAAKRSLLDLIGVAVAGSATQSSRIARQVAISQWPAGEKCSTLIFDGRKAAPAGAAFAGGQTIDAVDAHDGYKPAKGHAGVAILPALLAVMEAEKLSLSSSQFLEAFILGYEIACRVATVQHSSCPDYHSSGSWNSMGVAAVTSRILKLSKVRTREALGITEYYGPRAQMMRVIDHPTNLKDSSSWGASTGVTSAYLAAAGFTGAPAITIEAESAASVWSDLGTRWLMAEQYFKLWPVCRWAQPAVKAALDLIATKRIDHEQIENIDIITFHEARRLEGHDPKTTDEAQYSIAFPVACAFVRGTVGLAEVTESGLNDSAIRSLAKRIRLGESAEFSSMFPARRFARLEVRLIDGTMIESLATEAPGDPETALSDFELLQKFESLVSPILGMSVVEEVANILPLTENRHFDLPALLNVVFAART